MNTPTFLTGVPARYAGVVRDLLHVPENDRGPAWHEEFRRALTALKRSVTNGDATDAECASVAKLDGPGLEGRVQAWERAALLSLKAGYGEGDSDGATLTDPPEASDVVAPPTREPRQRAEAMDGPASGNMTET